MNNKKKLEVLISITGFKEIVSFIFFMLMIGGMIYIISKTGDNLFIVIPMITAYIAFVTIILCKASTFYHRFFNDEKKNDQES